MLHQSESLWSKGLNSFISIIFQQEEISEQQVRVGLIEKKLESATKDSDEKVDTIQNKFEDAQNQLKRKEK